MTIICTEEEKDRIVGAIVHSSICPFMTKCTDGGDCEECAPKKIKWVIQEESSNA